MIYKECENSKEKWLKKRHVINFAMIHAQCRGSTLTKSVREYKTVTDDDFRSYSEKEKLEKTSCRRLDRNYLHLDFHLAKTF